MQQNAVDCGVIVCKVTNNSYGVNKIKYILKNCVNNYKLMVKLFHLSTIANVFHIAALFNSSLLYTGSKQGGYNWKSSNWQLRCA